MFNEKCAKRILFFVISFLSFIILISFAMAEDEAWNKNGNIDWKIEGETLAVRTRSPKEYTWDSQEWLQQIDQVKNVLILDGSGKNLYKIIELEPKSALIVPDCVEVIKADALCYAKIAGISLSSNLKIIESCALAWCENLTEITLPESLELIEGGGLCSCHSLQTVVFRGSKCELKECVFDSDCKLQSIILPASEELNTTLRFCDQLKTVILTEGTKYITHYTFAECKKLESVYIPDSVEEITSDIFDIYNGKSKAVILCHAGSYAESFAKQAGIKYKIVVSVDNVSISEQDLVLQKGKQTKLNAIITPDNATNKKVEWASTDPTIAIVNNGNVKAVSCGECDILCRSTDGIGIAAVCHVNVIQLVQSIQTKDKKLTIPFGGAVEPEVIIKPEDATNQTLSWSSSDETVCSVDENGKITAVGAGDCEIILATTDGSNKSAKLSVHVPIFDMVEAEYFVDNQDEYVIPLDLHGFSVEKISHKASSDKFFLYFVEQNGIHVYPIAEGKATITLTSNENKNDICKINVIVPSEILGDASPQVIVVLDKTFVKPGETVTAKYYIRGINPPYSVSECEWRCESSEGGATASTQKITKYPAGTVSLKVGGEDRINAYAEIKVCDNDGVSASMISNKVPVDHLEFVLHEDVAVLMRNSPVRLTYSIMGGSGKYNVEVVWSALNNDSGVLSEIGKTKTTSEGEGGAEQTFTWGDGVFFTLTATDTKSKQFTKSLREYSFNGVPLTDDWYLIIEYDQEVAAIGVPIRAHIITNDTSRIESNRFGWRCFKKDDSGSSDLGNLICENDEYYVEVIPSDEYSAMRFFVEGEMVWREGKLIKIVD